MLHLAIAFGIPPKKLGRQLSARGFAEYVALNRVDPWGPARSDLQAATAAYGAAAVWSEKIQIGDFVLPYGQTDEEKEEKFRLQLQSLQLSTLDF